MPSKVKKQSKLSSLWTKIKPNTPAKKLLAFVLVFGVIAGGYFAYQSFASTKSYYINSSELKGGYIVTDSKSTNKRTSQVRYAGPGDTISASIKGPFWANTVQACVTFRALSTSNSKKPTLIHSYGHRGYGDWYSIYKTYGGGTSSYYTTLCTEPMNNARFGGDNGHTMSFKSEGKSVYVHNFFYKYW